MAGGSALWPVYLLAFLNGLFALVTSSVGNVLVPESVKTEQLPRANSLVQVATTGVPLLGFAAGGLLVASAGVAIAILVAAVCFAGLVSTAAVLTYPARQPNRPALKHDLTQGLAEVKRQPALAQLLALALVLNAIVASINVLVPSEMVRLGLGAGGYGWFESLFAAGVLLGLLLVSIAGQGDETVLFAVTLMLETGGFALLSAGQPPTYFSGALALGAATGAVSVLTLTAFQQRVRDAVLGKTLGLLSTATAAGLAIGLFLTGFVADHTRPATVFLASTATSALLLALLLAGANARARRMRCATTERRVGP